MEHSKEVLLKNGKELKTISNPEVVNTFVVPFAVQEAYDDKSKMAPNTNNETNRDSFSPTSSSSATKTLTVTPTDEQARSLLILSPSETKNDILDTNQSGDAEKRTTEVSNSNVFCSNTANVDKQSKIKFNESTQWKEYKEKHHLLRKRHKKYKPVVKFNNFNYKYKMPKNNLSRRLEKYYVKTKINSPSIDDFNSSKPINSVLTESFKGTPLKANVDNVSVAEMSSSPKLNNQTGVIQNDNVSKDETIKVASIERQTPILASSASGIYKANSQSNFANLKLKDTESSNVTLTCDRTSLKSNSDNVFLSIAGTNSDFTSATHAKCYSETEKSNSMYRVCVEEMAVHSSFSNQNALLNTVIKLGFYPEMTPSTSSGLYIENKASDILVTEDILTNFQQITKKECGNNPNSIQNELTRVITSKPFNKQSDVHLNKITLPNEAAIKAVVNGTDKFQKPTLTEDLGDTFLSADLTKMWDKLLLLVDSSVKRLEDNLTEKITKGIKESLPNTLMSAKSDVTKQTISLTDIKTEKIPTEKHETNTLNKEIVAVAEEVRTNNDQGLQCDLVENQVIDQIMLKFTLDRPGSQVSLQSVNKPHMIRNYLEILKPPADDNIEIGKVDTGTVAMTTRKKYSAFKRIGTICPVSFIRENMLVITSVPSYFVVLFCFYGIFIIFVNP